MSLQGRVAVIAGATGELGRTVASALAQAQVRVVLVGTNQERLTKLSSDLALSSEQTLLHVANLRDSPEAQGLAQAVADKFGRVDILLNLVGGWIGGKTVVEFSTTDTEDMLQQHLWTTWHLSQAFVPRLLNNGWGRILLISSPIVTRPAANNAPYAIGKAAQDALMMTLAQELRGTRVTANVLQVGTIDTKRERDRLRTPENASWTTPEEITAAVLYLCSEEAQVINGARIPLYGG